MKPLETICRVRVANTTPRTVANPAVWIHARKYSDHYDLEDVGSTIVGRGGGVACHKEHPRDAAALRINVYTADPGTSEDALKVLASWAATQRSTAEAALKEKK